MSNWDAKYAAEPRGLFGVEANAYVRALASRPDFEAKSALCLADGDGRNSRFLAQAGLIVTAVDLSQVACANGTALDRQAGVAVERIAADLEHWQVPAGEQWDAVFLIYLQAPWPVRQAALRIALAAVAAGGWVIVEGFAKGAGEGACGPEGDDLRYDLDELGRELEGIKTVEALTGDMLLEEGERHRGLARVVRFAGRKVRS